MILPSMDISINMITMFAFIVTLGIVVDDAIVVGENIYHHRQNGFPWFKAAVKGAREIAMPVTFSVLTNMVAFMPLLYVPGVMGKIFKQIPFVVISVFAVSLIESLFILPAHIGHQNARDGSGLLGWIQMQQQKFSHFFLTAVVREISLFLFSGSGAFTIRHKMVAEKLGLACEVQSKPGST